MSVARKDCRLSSGPVQPDNLPYRHGLCAATIIPEPQKRNEVTAFDAQMMRELDLRSPLQQAVAERAVMMAWKLRHVREVEAELVDQEFAALRDSYPDDYKTPASAEVWHLVNEGGKNCRVNPFSTLRRYESSIERSFYRSIMI